MSIFKKKSSQSTRSMLAAEERRYILNKDSDFSIKEAYNVLRSNITFSVSDKGCKVIEVTSAFASEGKSITAMNIAVSFAQVGKKVLLVDVDLRRPKVHKLMNCKASPGFSNVIIGENTIDEVVRHEEKLGIDVICSGNIPPMSTSLLESDAVAEFIATVRKEYDYVLLDTPPVNIVIDSCVLTKYSNGIIFVIRENFAKREKIIAAVNQLKFAGGKIVGYVLNGIMQKNIVPIGGYKRYSRYYNYKYNYNYRYNYYSSYSSAARERMQEEREIREKAMEEALQKETQNAERITTEVKMVKAEPEKSETKPVKAEPKPDIKTDSNEKSEVVSREKPLRDSVQKIEKPEAPKKPLNAEGVKRTEAMTYESTSKNEKKKTKIRYAVIAVIGVILVCIALFLAFNWSNLSAIYGGVTNTKEEIVIQQKNNEAKINGLVKSITSANVNALSEDMRVKLENGEITEADAIEIILGSDYGKWVASGRENESGGGEQLAEYTPAKAKHSNKDQTIAKIYLLRSTYTGKIDSLISKGKTAVKALPPSERTASKQFEIADNLIDAGLALESECDAQMEALLSELEQDLESSGEDTGVISEIRDAYENEKKLKKEELFNTYYPN